jgi:Serine aminopeptidase, S33
MDTQEQSAVYRMEQPGYIPAPGGNIYTVLHRVEDPVGRVLLIGPFASERQTSYLPWVKWARHLASRRIEVLRFDYRGVGESGGIFEEMTFDGWMEDVGWVLDWFRRRGPQVPILLHGLETGALFASRSFVEGFGDALLLWSPALSANQSLRSTLARWLGIEQLLTPVAERRKPSDYLEQLNNGQAIEVDGNVWSTRLWENSVAWNLDQAFHSPGDLTIGSRPGRIVKLPSTAAPLVKGGFVGFDEARDFEWLFGEHSTWIQDKIFPGAIRNDDPVQ